MARFKMRYSPEIAIALGLVVLIGASAVAQGRAYPDLGRAPTAEQIRKWDIAIGQAGRELPPGSGTVPQGAFLYALNFTSREPLRYGAPDLTIGRPRGGLRRARGFAPATS